ncbi:MAG: HTTM domain-containing protein [Bacteroidota bacterium]
MRQALHKLNDFLFKEVSIAPLVIFRLILGGVLLFGTIRTVQNGWITELYIDPIYHFGFFPWLQPLGLEGMYLVYFLMGVSAVGIILGLFYRINTLLFLLLFTYCELLDKTYYLNHYYLVSILTFWLSLVPAHRWYAVDTLIFPKIKRSTCANWQILIFKVQLSVVYFFAGLAKVNPDWLFRAQPMATWLPGKYEIPILGRWVHLKATAFLFSWSGCIYDLSIWIFLWIKKTRPYAYVLVLGFHILTYILFPRIGMFPLIMISSTIIFFAPEWHQKLLSLLPFSPDGNGYAKSRELQQKWQTVVSTALVVYLLIQLYLPLRHLQYPGNLFWHEQGYRFSWRVMLMEKNGMTSIIVRDPVQNIQREVDQNNYLTPFQKQQMRSQPDMLIQFAKYVGDQFYQVKGYPPEIYVKSRISLNGRRSQAFTNDTLDIYSLANPMKHHWILPFKEL